MEIKDEVLPALDHRQKSLRDPLRPDPDKPTPRSGASWFDRDGFLDYNRNDSDAVNLLKGVAAAVVAVPLLVGAIVGVVYLAMQVPVAGLAMVCIAGYAISHAGGIG
ncbi:hypothetical protein IV102_13885 [bacterium]|nr:hypothetical protein [bacterium]